jgi:predicted ATPase
LQSDEQVVEGMGQVVLLSGEAGIGKSRLVRELKEYVARNLQAWLTECYCSPYHQSSAFYPIIDLFERAVLQFQHEDSPQEKLNKIERYLVQYGLSLPETVPLFATLLSIPLSEKYSPLYLTPERQKQKTLATLLALLLERAAQQPVLLIIEDLHWADPSTLELLNLIIDQGPTAKILTLLTFRPDFTPPWPMRSHFTYIILTRLLHKEVENMVGWITGGKALPETVREHILSKTDGVPLFVEEMTKMVLESGLLKERGDQYELAGPLLQLAVPTTLRDLLAARLDRLTTAKEVAQLGAVLGREFPYEWLQAVSPLDKATLHQELARLVEAELVYRRGVPPHLTYIFKHSLIQEAAYESLLKSKRQQYHQQVAEILTNRFPNTVEARPELLAHHYKSAGLIEQAIPCLHLAGQKAIERSANQEAISHLTQGLELLKTLPDTPGRIQQELTLQTTLGLPLTAAKGFESPEVERVYSRAWELCLQVEKTPDLFPILLGLARFFLVRAELKKAHELGVQLLTLAQSVQDPMLLLAAHLTLGATLFYLGELTEARVHLERGIFLYDPKQHHLYAFYGIEPKVFCLSYAALVLWLLGYPDQALQSSHDALALAHELAHPYSQAFALSFAAVLHHLRREGQAAQDRSEAVLTLSADQGFPNWLLWGTFLQGWGLAQQGQREEAIAQMRQALTSSRAMGTELVLTPLTLCLLADGYRGLGQPQEALSMLTEALAAVHKHAERFYEAEVYRLNGELLLSQRVETDFNPAPTEAAEACFHQALDVARRQQAKSWELRAVMSLSRLWQRQGKREEAKQLLEEICGWFTEGFDTADLQEAKALLKELS